MPKEVTLVNQISFGNYLLWFPAGNQLTDMLTRRKSKVPELPHMCPLSKCMSVLGGVWTPNIIWYLSNGPRRFSELKDDINGISAKVLTSRLKKLTEMGVIAREVIPTSPPTVEYSLSEIGFELKPAIEAIVRVGQRLKKMHSPA